MPVDKLRVKERLALIDHYLVELEELSHLSKEEFLIERTAAAAESFLRRILETIFDVGRHILAKNGGINLALEHKGIARGLGSIGIINGQLQEKLVQMAGYRNRLVHLYHQVTGEELYEVVKSDLGEIRQFNQEILKYVTAEVRENPTE